VAGPIERYAQVARRINVRPISAWRVRTGMLMFLFGLAQKVVIADTVAVTADAIFKPPTVELMVTKAIAPAPRIGHEDRRPDSGRLRGPVLRQHRLRHGAGRGGRGSANRVASHPVTGRAGERGRSGYRSCQADDPRIARKGRRSAGSTPASDRRSAAADRGVAGVLFPIHPACMQSLGWIGKWEPAEFLQFSAA
jgi:hypothetical protein